MLKEAKRIPEEILGKVSIAVSCGWENACTTPGSFLCFCICAFPSWSWAGGGWCVRWEQGSRFPSTFHNSHPWCCTIWWSPDREKLPWAINPRLVIVTVGVGFCSVTESIQWPLLTAIHSESVAKLEVLTHHREAFLTELRCGSTEVYATCLNWMQNTLLLSSYPVFGFLLGSERFGLSEREAPNHAQRWEEEPNNSCLCWRSPVLPRAMFTLFSLTVVRCEAFQHPG